MDRGAWRAAVHGVTQSQTRLSDFTFEEFISDQLLLQAEFVTPSSVLPDPLPQFCPFHFCL